MEAKRDASFNIRLPKAELDILKVYCAKKGRTQSDVVRELIRSLEKTI